MKEGMTNVDVAALAVELDGILAGGRLEKAYQPAKDQILLRLRRKGLGRLDLICQLGKYVTLTRKPPENPDKPSMVAQILRNDFGNARIRGVRQIGFDRLLRIDLERGDGDKAIVFELFGEGNMLLLDADDVIHLPLRGAEHGARRLKKGELYVPPPGSEQPFAMPAEEFAQRLADAKRDVVRFLALDLGLGPLWAEEICLRAGVAKNTKVAGVDPEPLREAVHALGADIAGDRMTPALVFEDGEAVDAVPFVMERYPTPPFQYEEATQFHAALDVYFRGASEEDEDPRRARYEDARAKVERQRTQMQEAIDGFIEDEKQSHGKGEVLYLRFQEVQQILDSLRAAREQRSWQEIAETLRQAREAGDEAAQAVLSLRPDKATAVLALTDLEDNPWEVTIDLRQTVQENADAHYAAAKKAKSRQVGAAKALAETQGRLDEMEAKGLDAFGAAPKAAAISKHFWFENYRWCPLPGGFLAVGGRNAGQNDAVVKKYLRDGDRYVHAQIHGAPSVVVRAADGSTNEPDETALRLAGQFATCSSRGWRQFGEASAYWVTPQQVSKTPRSGEFVPRGAWIIHGKRTPLDRLPMEWAVGLVPFSRGGVPGVAEDQVIKLAGGPPDAIAAFADKVVRLVPGDMNPNDAAALLAERFDVDIESAQAALPGGPVRVVE